MGEPGDQTQRSGSSTLTCAWTGCTLAPLDVQGSASDTLENALDFLPNVLRSVSLRLGRRPCNGTSCSDPDRVSDRNLAAVGSPASNGCSRPRFRARRYRAYSADWVSLGPGGRACRVVSGALL